MDHLVNYMDPHMNFMEHLIDFPYRFQGSPSRFVQNYMDPLIDYMDPHMNFMEHFIDFPHRFHGSPFRFA